jgi:DNA-binding NtrC family response regulator
MSSHPLVVGEEPKGLVLIAEHDRDLREVIANHLEAQGWRVVAVGNGPEAATRALQERFAAIVLDIHTAAPWEIVVLQTLRALGSTLPVIVITGFGDTLAAEQARKLGATKILEKPFDLEALEKAMQGSC